MANKRVRGALNKDSLRNLRQYKNMSDEQFEDLWEDKVTGLEVSSEFEKRIKRKLDEFEEDYDLSDLKVNDKLTLRALAQVYIYLEDLENYSFNNRINGFDISSILELEKLNNMMSSLRKDISNMQNDLSITRKIRKGDQELTVASELERLKSKAREFYEQKMFYAFCPKCNMLLATAWFLYPDEKQNKIQLVCNRKLDSGELCGHKFQISSAELLNNKGTNSTMIPDTLK